MTVDVEQGSLAFLKQDHLTVYNSSEWGRTWILQCVWYQYILAYQGSELLQYQRVFSK